MYSESTAYSMPSSTPHLRLVEDRATYDAGAPANHRTVIADDLLETIGEELGDTCGWLYVILERHANKQGWCDPSEERLAKLSRRTVRWVREALGRLEAAGFIRIERGRKTKYNTPDTNAYTLPYHLNGLPEIGQTVPERVAERVAEGSAEGLTPNRSAKVVSSHSSSQKVGNALALSDGAQRRLVDFRDAYPTHRKSGNARELAEAWAALTDDEQGQAISAVKAWAQSDDWQDQNGKFVPGIVKFLTERRFESAPAPVPTTGNRTVDLLRAMGI